MKLQEMLESHQHPAPGAPSVGSTHDHGVVHLLDDGDEIITLQLRERQREREREEKWCDQEIWNKCLWKRYITKSKNCCVCGGVGVGCVCVGAWGCV